MGKHRATFGPRFSFTTQHDATFSSVTMGISRFFYRSKELNWVSVRLHGADVDYHEKGRADRTTQRFGFRGYGVALEYGLLGDKEGFIFRGAYGRMNNAGHVTGDRERRFDYGAYTYLGPIRGAAFYAGVGSTYAHYVGPRFRMGVRFGMGKDDGTYMAVGVGEGGFILDGSFSIIKNEMILRPQLIAANQNLQFAINVLYRLN